MKVTESLLKVYETGKLLELPASLPDLLDVLRLVTLDVVEAITLWRLAQVSVLSL